MRPSGVFGLAATSFLIAVPLLPACRTSGTARSSWEEAGLAPAQLQLQRADRSVLDRSTDALVEAIEAVTGERPVFDGQGYDFEPLPETAVLPAHEAHQDWITERRVLAMDLLRLPAVSRRDRESVRRARAALRWDVALDAHWNEVDARLVRQALQQADSELGIKTLPVPPPPTLADLFSWPINPVRITSRFGVREDPLGEGVRRHTGVDLSGAIGQPVSSAGDGIVSFVGNRGAYGLHVEVRHAQGLTSRYAHLSAVLVSRGEPVQAGTLIGRVGQSGRATGPHLHFEIWEDGLPVDPVEALPPAPVTWDRPLAGR